MDGFPEELAADLGPGDQLRLTMARPAEAQNLIKASYEYAVRFAQMTVRSAVVEIRANLEREGDLQQFELALLVNLLPRSADEAKALIPSLVRLPPARLARILETLEVFRVHAA